MKPVPVGQIGEIVVGGRKLKVRNPGPRWVLEAQEECTGVGGRLNVIRYVQMILDECVVEPKLTLDDFSHETEVMELLKEFNAFRRPEAIRVETEDAYCPPGKPVTVRVGDKEFKLVNPGVRWVLEAQEESTLPTGVLSFSTYTDRVLKNCVVGGAVTLDDFAHEDEVFAFLRSFRLVRRAPSETTARSEAGEVA